ncbi:MAG: choice-of-anchor L domain-containing protein [Flavobacteriales bacterium]|nr:choice-of-anchor L domain-containing protein [Flavobacteriales bacterium]
MAQLIVGNSFPNNSPDSLVQNVLIANGITITNVLFNGSAAIPTGADSNAIGYFDGSISNLGIAFGVIMNTGNIYDAPGPNNSGSDGVDIGMPGDADLTTLAGFATFDAAILEFDFVTTGSNVFFKYAFASEEYNEFVCSGFNDVFGFFLSGPGIAGPFSNNAMNIALIPGSSTFVAINTVNNGTVGSAGQAGGCGGIGDPGLNNALYFVDNEAPGQQSIQYDGFTVPLITTYTVTPGQMYHLKIAIADAGDGIFDSGLFLEGGSFAGPGPISFVLDSVIPDTCGGNPGGSIEMTVLGTNPPFTYAWSNGDTTLDISNLTSGTYTLSVVDGLGQTGSFTVIVGEEKFTMQIIAVPTPCDSSVGSITVVLSGGNPPFTYLWSDSLAQTNNTASGLAVGNYSISVTDGIGCSSSDSAWVGSEGLPLNIVTTSPSCYADSDGMMIVAVGGGIPPYSFLWNDPVAQTTSAASGLFGGTYIVAVSDSGGCLGMDSATIVEPPLLMLDAAVMDVVCSGDSDGSVILIPSGGTTPYTYLWNQCTGVTPTDSVAPGLGAGTCCVDLIDFNLCSYSDCFVISGPSPFSWFIVASPSTQNAGNGACNLSVTGGTPPYQYLWSNGATSEDIDSLSAGTYLVTVTDSVGCSFIDSAIVEEVVSIAKVHSTQLLFARIYPNPNVGDFNVVLTVSGDFTADLVIRNILGKVVHELLRIPMSRGENFISIHSLDLSKGVYLLELVVGDSRAVRKIVIR